MLFSRKALVWILIASVIIPGIVEANRHVFIPLVAKSLTFDQFYRQANLFVNHPVRIKGVTGGLYAMLNLSLWNAVSPQMRLTGVYNIISTGARELLARYSSLVFFSEYTYVPREERGFNVQTFQLVRLQYGIPVERVLPIAFLQPPPFVPYNDTVLGVARQLDVNGISFYYLDFLSW